MIAEAAQKVIDEAVVAAQEEMDDAKRVDDEAEAARKAAGGRKDDEGANKVANEDEAGMRKTADVVQIESLIILQKASVEPSEKIAALVDDVGMKKDVIVPGNEQIGDSVDKEGVKVAGSEIVASPAKVYRLEDGSKAPGNEQLLSSPEQVHKDPRVGLSKLPVFTSKVGKALSQTDSSTCPSMPSCGGMDMSAGSEFLSDPGSSNANRPASASLDLEQNSN